MPKALILALIAFALGTLAVVGRQETASLAAEPTGALSGVVTDSAGHPLAVVAVSAVAGSMTRTTVTGSKGNYTITGLSPDTYTVTFSKEGYITQQVSGVTIAQGQSVAVSLSVSARSPSQSLEQLVKRLRGNPDDVALREKIASTVAIMNQKPSIPETARGYFIEAVALQKQARTPTDYDLAILDYKKALVAAPWWSDAYYDLATALELTHQYADAIENLKLSVMADPKGPGARAAQDKMYVVEAEQQKADAAKSIADNARADQNAAAATQAQAEKVVDAFQGTWYGRECYIEPMSLASLDRGCTDSERAEANWYDFTGPNGPEVLSFTLPGDGTVTLSGMVVWAGCGTGPVVGVPQGPDFDSDVRMDIGNIRWEVRPQDGPAREVYSKVWNDANLEPNIEVSCNRPLTGGDPNAAFKYVWFSRHP